MPKVEGRIAIDLFTQIKVWAKLEGYKREDLLEIALDLVKKIEELHSKIY